MAKEEVHNWMRTAILLLGIVFAGGGYAMKISDNSNGVDKLEEKVQILEVNQAEKIATDKAIASTLAQLRVGIDSIRTDQSVMKTDMAIMKTKVDTLIKD